MKKTLSLILVFAIISMTATTAFADVTVDDSAEVTALLQKRAEFICLEEYDKVQQIDEQLRKYGVERLTAKEVQKRFSDVDGIAPYVLAPDASNVDWASMRKTYIKNGVTYEVQTLIAQPNSKSSNLKKSGSKALSSTYRWQVGGMNAISVLVSGLGGIKLSTGASLAVTAYDTVKAALTGISKTTEISSADIIYSYAHTTTATFKYVKVNGQSDNAQSMTYVSTMGTTVVGYQYPTFVYSGGNVAPTVIQGSRTIESIPVGYDSNDYAIEAYLNGPTRKACISSVKITGIETKAVATISPVVPEFPAHIY